MIEDSFEMLGVSPNASLNEVKKSFRTLAKKNHPDLFMETEEKKKREIKMAEINSAYQELLSLFKEEKKEETVEPQEKPKSAEENDYTVYKKGVEYFNQYSGSISLKHRQYNAVDLETLLEKKKNIETAKTIFIRLLKDYPESDWAFDSEERLKKIEKILKDLEGNIADHHERAHPRSDYAFYYNYAKGNRRK